MKQVDHDEGFKLLDQELVDMGRSLRIIVAGGYILDRLNLRQTFDVDAFFENTPELQAALERVSEKLNVGGGETWLNTSISSMNAIPPQDAIAETLLFDNLQVDMVDPVYVIGMKLESGRETDLEDVGLLISHLKEQDPIELLNKINNWDLFPDASNLLEGFTRAYGMDWLTAYYSEHEGDINGLF